MILRCLLLSIALCLSLAGCTEEAGENEDYILRVNDFTISSDEIDSQLKFEAILDSNFYPSTDTRTELVKDLIQSQVLIQEAKKRKFDQREEFRLAIQRYWESTLIRDLLAEKGKELRESTVVNLEEIEAYYENNKEFLPDGTLEELKPELIEKIEDQKVNARLAAWIEDLQAKADIEIKDAELAVKVNNGKGDG